MPLGLGTEAFSEGFAQEVIPAGFTEDRGSNTLNKRSFIRFCFVKLVFPYIT